MKKIIILITLTFIRVILHAQTGIGTITPQQQLQVSGASSSTQIGTTGIFVVKPTIRIDGLNNTNNPVASGSTSLVQAVSVTQDGDFILSPNAAISLVNTSPGADAIPTPVTVTAPGISTPPGNNNAVFSIIRTFTFTLNQSCMVHFLASVSATIQSTGGALLTDNKNKAYTSFFELTSAPAGVNTFFFFGTDSYSYINTTSLLPGTSGNMYLQPEANLILPPGNYTLALVGQVYGDDYAFRCIFGGAANDMVSVVATPL